MGQRNMSDMEIDQQAQGYLPPDPSFLMGGITNFRQPNIHTLVSSSGNNTNHFPEPYEGGLVYGMPQYIHVQDHHPPEPNFYNAYVAPSGSGLIPVPPNHGSADHLPSSSSSNYAAFGVPNSQSMDGAGGFPFKRKNAEGIMGNLQYFNSSATSSSSAVPFNTMHHSEGVAIMDAVSFGLPQFRGNGLGSTAIDPIQVHGHNHLVQGNFMGQPFQPSGTRWMDQQISSSSSGGGASAWTRSPPIPYVHENNANGGMALHGYHNETGSSRSSSSFFHPPPNHPHFNAHYPLPQPVQGARVHNVNLYPQGARVHNITASRNMTGPSQDGLELDSRHPRPVRTTGFGNYRPETTTLRYQNRPRFRYYQADEVAIMESPEFYEAGNAVDHHSDMRMDIEDMTYEDLLALEERIGNVNNGLTEDDIVKQMKTRVYASSSATINLEEPAPSVDEESDSCIICQDDYVNKEKIGTLGCGHEYHADCLKKWLLVKNVCPICKSEAVSMGRKLT